MREKEVSLKWALLFLAVVLEVIGTTSMKLSNGFSRLLPSLYMFGFYAASLVVLNMAMKRLPIGIAYAVWSALGTILISSIGALYFKESITPLQIVFLSLIVVGVAGLHFSSPGSSL
ncbi:multidrug efflux SMR transporter [Alicyclobacillus sp. SO9]|uniref:DMT family transporter n=1 Tax=Alicyclobacillus sp. SO9 TaxID=2665646 RepID=UPI0018E7B287|nr:multidrug efflux SMR transporter [Alicyclobacillus sp. SO9]QQE79822.1 multidrug efflux SMR transporter [Alicyclobacillus sp. SO9]